MCSGSALWCLQVDKPFWVHKEVEEVCLATSMSLVLSACLPHLSAYAHTLFVSFVCTWSARACLPDMYHRRP